MKKPQSLIGIWIALGAALGVPIGNIPLSVGIGACIGFLLLLFFYRGNLKKRCKNNDISR